MQLRITSIFFVCGCGIYALPADPLLENLYRKNLTEIFAIFGPVCRAEKPGIRDGSS